MVGRQRRDHVVSGQRRNDDVIGRWADKSGGAVHFTQTTTANKPLLKTATLNSRNTIYFAGTDDFLTGGDVLDLRTNNALIVVVGKKVSTGATNEAYFAKQDAPAAGRYNLLYEGGSLVAVYQNGTGNKVASAARTGGSYEISMLRINRSASGAIRLYANGSALATTTFTPEATDYNPAVSARIGRANTIYPLTGNIAEVPVYLRASEFSDDDVAALNAHLNAKWSVY